MNTVNLIHGFGQITAETASASPASGAVVATAGAIPGDLSILLWAPALLLTLGCLGWLVVLIAMQQQRKLRHARVTDRTAGMLASVPGARTASRDARGASTSLAA
jgi:hypothetical protein